MGVKFNDHSDEEWCGEVIPGSEEKYPDEGGIVCLRGAGHAPPCIAMACDAGTADGVHWCCRQVLGGEHAEWCFKHPEFKDEEEKP